MRLATNLLIPVTLLALSSSMAMYQLQRNRTVIAELNQLSILSERVTHLTEANSQQTNAYTPESFPYIEISTEATTSVEAESDIAGEMIRNTVATETPAPTRAQAPPATAPQPRIVNIENETDATTTTTEAYLEALAVAIHKETNRNRDRRNVSELMYDERLEYVATERSLDMATRDYFSHTTPDGCDIECHFDATTLETIAWGENIGWYEPYQIRTPEELAEYFVEWWIDSRSHRENLLATDFTHEGIGIATRNDKLIVTVVFADW